MRIPNLRKKIIINFSVSFLLFVFLGVIVNFYFNQKNDIEEKIRKINNEIDRKKEELLALESKTAEVNKYTEIWQKISSNKTNTNGIKIDDFNSKLNSLADKHSINNLNLRISLPEALKDGIFKRDTLDIMLTTVNITFTALNDLKAISFINDFISSVQGYPIVTSFEIKKSKDYTDQDLQNIASGKGSGNVSGKIDFFWYVYKDSTTSSQ